MLLTIDIDINSIKRWGGIFIPSFRAMAHANGDKTIIGIEPPHTPGFEFNIPEEGSVFKFTISPSSDNPEAENPCYHCNMSIYCDHTKCSQEKGFKSFEMIDGHSEYCENECGLYDSKKECGFKLDCAINKFRNSTKKGFTNEQASK